MTPEELKIDDNIATMIHTPNPNIPIIRHLREYTLGLVYRVSRRACQTRWTPNHVTFQHHRPSDASLHRAFFEAEVRFEQAEDSLVFDAQLLSMPMAETDPVILEILNRRLDAMLSELAPQPFSTEMRRVAWQQMMSGNLPSLDEIAQRLGLSGRTLQRRLSREDLKFQDLIEELRRNLALGYLENPNIAITDVSVLLNFSEPSAFHRAFQRWMGMTPAQYRKRCE